jgi:hypothetical protein
MSWAAVAIGAGTAIAGGVSAYGASQQEGPQTISPTEQALQQMNALSAYSLPTWALNQHYAPMFNATSANMAYDSLFGSQGGRHTINVPIWQDGHVKNYVHSYKTPGTPGMLNMYKQAGKEMSDYNNRQLLKNLTQYAPGLTAAYKGSNPGLAGLESSLMTQAQEGLDAGSGLDPFTRRELTQASLGDASLRGFGKSPLDAYMTYSALGREGEMRRQAHQQQAMNIGNFSAGITPDPISLVNQPSLATAMGPMLGSQAFGASRQGATPAYANPFGAGYQQLEGNNNAANSWMALGGGMMNAAGGFGGNYMQNRQQPLANGGVYGFNNQPSYPIMGGQAYTATF